MASVTLYLLVMAAWNGCTCSSRHCELLIAVDVAANKGCCNSDNRTQITCDSFQEALECVDNVDDIYNCTEILLNDGNHVITHNVTIISNIHIRPNTISTQERIIVSFNLTDSVLLSKLASEYEPLHIIRFEGSDFAMIEGLTFFGSNGIISFYDVALAAINNCTFRYTLHAHFLISLFNLSTFLLPSISLTLVF